MALREGNRRRAFEYRGEESVKDIRAQLVAIKEATLESLVVVFQWAQAANACGAPVLFIDGAHVSKTAGYGCMITVSARVVNTYIPVAMAFSLTEESGIILELLKQLKECAPEAFLRDLAALFSDRGAAIIKAVDLFVETQAPRMAHFHCRLHVLLNFFKTFPALRKETERSTSLVKALLYALNEEQWLKAAGQLDAHYLGLTGFKEKAKGKKAHAAGKGTAGAAAVAAVVAASAAAPASAAAEEAGAAADTTAADTAEDAAADAEKVEPLPDAFGDTFPNVADMNDADVELIIPDSDVKAAKAIPSSAAGGEKPTYTPSHYALELKRLIGPKIFVHCMTRTDLGFNATSPSESLNGVLKRRGLRDTDITSALLGIMSMTGAFFKGARDEVNKNIANNNVIVPCWPSYSRGQTQASSMNDLCLVDEAETSCTVVHNKYPSRRHHVELWEDGHQSGASTHWTQGLSPFGTACNGLCYTPQREHIACAELVLFIRRKAHSAPKEVQEERFRALLKSVHAPWYHADYLQAALRIRPLLGMRLPTLKDLSAITGFILNPVKPFAKPSVDRLASNGGRPAGSTSSAAGGGPSIAVANLELYQEVPGAAAAAAASAAAASAGATSPSRSRLKALRVEPRQKHASEPQLKKTKKSPPCMKCGKTGHSPSNCPTN